MTTTGAILRRPRLRPRLAHGLLRAARPHQWVKNVLVLAAPAAAGVVLAPGALAATLLAVVAFVLASSGCYLLNDVVDRNADRLHPRKRYRPIASGAVPVPTALAAAAVLGLAALSLGYAVHPGLGVVVTAYIAITVAYGLGLKSVPGLELVLLASGFVLRCLAGAAASRVPLSSWFVVVAGAAALHVAASKRASELRTLGPAATGHRRALRAYTPAGLRSLRRWTAATVVAAYAGWALTRPQLDGRAFALLSLVALVVALLRWMQQTEVGETEAPERVVVGDPVVRVAALGWTVAFAVSVLVA